MPLLRILAALAVTGFYYPPLVAGNLLFSPWRRRRRAWQGFVLRRWSRGMARILGMRIERDGEPPGAPFLLVANHVSYLDIFLLAGETGGVFVAKAEMRTWPVVGHLCRAVGIIFIDRESRRDLVRAGRGVADALADGGGVILFPEGTTGRGDVLLPFRASLLEGAARSRQPVWYASVSYRTPAGSPPADEVICFWGGVGLLAHVRRLLSLPTFTARVSFGPAPIADSDRKRLAERLREAMAERFEPSAPPAPDLNPPSAATPPATLRAR